MFFFCLFLLIINAHLFFHAYCQKCKNIRMVTYKKLKNSSSLFSNVNLFPKTLNAFLKINILIWGWVIYMV